MIQPGGSVRDDEVDRARPTSTASRWCSPACATSGTDRSEDCSRHRLRRPRARARLEARAVARACRRSSSRPATRGTAREDGAATTSTITEIPTRWSTSPKDEQIHADGGRARGAARRRRRRRLPRRGLRIFGPTRAAAQLESSKDFAKALHAAPRHPDRALRDLHRRGRGARVRRRSAARRSSSRPTASPPARAWSSRRRADEAHAAIDIDARRQQAAATPARAS